MVFLGNIVVTLDMVHQSRGVIAVLFQNRGVAAAAAALLYRGVAALFARGVAVLFSRGVAAFLHRGVAALLRLLSGRVVGWSLLLVESLVDVEGVHLLGPGDVVQLNKQFMWVS